MKSAKKWQAGYTIVETMIFLIISSALLLSAIGLFDPRIRSTQFSQSVQELATHIRSVSNEASTGTYPDTPGFTCSVDPTGVPQTGLSSATDDQGTRNDCIFVGKVMNFTVKNGAGCKDPIVSANCGSIDVYTAVGRRELDPIAHTPVTNIAQANPRLVLTPDITENFTLGYGTHVIGLYQIDGSGTNPPKAVNSAGFFQSSGGSYTNGALTSGSQNITTWGIATTIAGAQSRTEQDVNSDISTPSNLLDASKGGLLVCVQSGSVSRKAGITIGAVNESFAVSVIMDDSRC